VVFGLGLLEAVPASAYWLGRIHWTSIATGSRAGQTSCSMRSIGGRHSADSAGRRTLRTCCNRPQGAYNGDMGVTSDLFPSESCAGRSESSCSTTHVEVSSDIVGNVAFYTQTLAVPARRKLNDVTTRRGEYLFLRLRLRWLPHADLSVPGDCKAYRRFRGQVIHPYTDLLVHDMGPGLADNRRTSRHREASGGLRRCGESDWSRP
jgi:CxxC motif-containing protein (DUF1111 family)